MWQTFGLFSPPDIKSFPNGFIGKIRKSQFCINRYRKSHFVPPAIIENRNFSSTGTKKSLFFFFSPADAENDLIIFIDFVTSSQLFSFNFYYFIFKTLLFLFHPVFIPFFSPSFFLFFSLFVLPPSLLFFFKSFFLPYF